MAKARDAFRTISEVSDALDTPPHVLRFWESKFTQVKPVKRAGGRRYYRPGDIALLAGIKQLLHEDGLTIKGVQKILREKGVRHVSTLVPNPIDIEEAAPAAADVRQEATPSPRLRLVEDTVEEAELVEDPAATPEPAPAPIDAELPAEEPEVARDAAPETAPAEPVQEMAEEPDGQPVTLEPDTAAEAAAGETPEPRIEPAETPEEEPADQSAFAFDADEAAPEPAEAADTAPASAETPSAAETDDFPSDLPAAEPEPVAAAADDTWPDDVEAELAEPAPRALAHLARLGPADLRARADRLRPIADRLEALLAARGGQA